MNLIEFCNKNWYTLMDSIPENRDRYGNWIPSVTTVLKMIQDPWFDYVMQNFKPEVMEAARIWTEVHEWIETFFTDWAANDSQWFKNSVKFHSLYNIKIIEQEKQYMKWWISWKIDLIANVEYNINWIYNIDYKNCLKHSPKYLVQLWGYKYLNWNPWLLVYLKKKLKIVIVPDEYELIFIELKDYFLSKLETT